MKEDGITLIEIIITVVIIVVIMMIGFPTYIRLQERAKDKEAIGALRRIQEAEKFYFMQRTVYYPNAGSESNIGNINSNLKLSLPAGGSRDWNFTVNSNGCCQATRVGAGGGGRNWYLRIDDDGTLPRSDPPAGNCLQDGDPESDNPAQTGATNCYVSC